MLNIIVVDKASMHESGGGGTDKVAFYIQQLFCVFNK